MIINVSIVFSIDVIDEKSEETSISREKTGEYYCAHTTTNYSLDNSGQLLGLPITMYLIL